MGGSITRDKVMVACVVGEVTLITEPAIRSNVDRIHLIHYIKAGTEKDERARFYQSFYDATAEELRKAGIEIVEHSDAETYVFRSMMSKVYEILVEEAVQRKSLVYVNLSGGTNEYAAAAAICSMMYKDVEVFTVGKGYDGRTRDYDQLRENAMKDGKLVGSCSTIGGTYMVDKYPIDRPDDNLLKAFKVYAVISQSEHRNSNTTVIRNLILQNVWMAKGPLEERAAIKGTSVELELPDRGYACPRERMATYIGRQRGEAVQYYRVYISQWESRGWIAKIPGTKKYAITNEGLTVLEVFCPEKFISFGTEDIVIQGEKYCRKTWRLPLSWYPRVLPESNPRPNGPKEAAATLIGILRCQN